MWYNAEQERIFAISYKLLLICKTFIFSKPLLIIKTKFILMKKIVFSIISFSSLLTCYSQQNQRLWYKSPAASWEECIPLGNGRLGAMPDCGIVNENIVLNDITLWSGAPQDADLS